MKHYHMSDEVRLIEAVEAQGGKYLPETCAADEIEYVMPDGSVRTPLSTGCEEDSLFLVAYDANETVNVREPILIEDPSPDAPKGRKKQKRDGKTLLFTAVERSGEGEIGEKSTVRVCANDDLMREWPRFRGEMHHPDPMRRGA